MFDQSCIEYSLKFLKDGEKLATLHKNTNKKNASFSNGLFKISLLEKHFNKINKNLSPLEVQTLTENYMNDDEEANEEEEEEGSDDDEEEGNVEEESESENNESGFSENWAHTCIDERTRMANGVCSLQAAYIKSQELDN
uniref:CSON006440 protein n=1 Tax=Culicoides sonorensis TaxID=179676 RepID=A0A336MXK0_CULSO